MNLRQTAAQKFQLSYGILISGCSSISIQDLRKPFPQILLGFSVGEIMNEDNTYTHTNDSELRVVTRCQTIKEKLQG
jgi:hypothetical protein